MGETNTQEINANPTVQSPTASSQWFVTPNGNRSEYVARGGNDILLLNCGEEYLPRFLEAIRAAKNTIYIAIWGFDPNLPLRLDSNNTNDRISKVLDGKSAEGVEIKILIWYNNIANTMHRSGGDNSHDDGLFSWSEIQRNPSLFDNIQIKTRDMPNNVQSPRTLQAIQMLQEEREQIDRSLQSRQDMSDMLALDQRRFEINREISNLRSQGFNLNEMQNNRRNRDIASASSMFEELFATHHQKMILIDHEVQGEEVGFVQGINFWPKYFDKKSHPYRTEGNRIQDVGLRLKGPCLIDLFHNFKQSWNETTDYIYNLGLFADITSEAPQISSRGNYTAQILRTWRENDEKNIFRFYMNSLGNNINNFIYVEDQYFRMPEFARALKARGKYILDRSQNQKLLHVFILTNLNALATGGKATRHAMLTGLGRSDIEVEGDEVEQLGDKDTLLDPDVLREMQQNGVKVHVCCLKNFGGTKTVQGRMTGEQYNSSMPYPLPTYEFSTQGIYGDVYVHSKLTIFDDAYLTLGSANWNQRSMVTDTELNIAVQSHDGLAKNFRHNLWSEHLAGLWSEVDRLKNRTGPTEWFDQWSDLLLKNLKLKAANQELIMNLFPLYEDMEVLRSTSGGGFG